MTAIFIGIVLGAILGAASATVEGAFIGGMLGFMVGFSVYAVRWLWAHSGSTPTVEHHRLICTPQGTFADAEFEGDVQRGKWIDVRRCSLQASGVRPTCEKSCLRMMNDSRIKPGRGCDCE